MFRQSLLPCICIVAALDFALLTLSARAPAQDLSAQERLDRVERDLNMLQRQVYGQAPRSDVGGGAVKAEIRMDRIEAQIRELTGRVEEVGNQVEQVRQRVEQINSDVETRFNQVAGGPGPVGPVDAPPARPVPGAGSSSRRFPSPPPGAIEDGSPSAAPRPTASLLPRGTLMPPPDGPNGDSLPPFGTLTPPGTPRGAPPVDLAGAATGAHPASGGLLPSGSATDQYNHAFGLLKKADYPGAEAELKTFIAQHPRDPMAGNAQYWLGETYYTRARYMEAAAAFAEGYKRYPKSAKAADGLLKLGMSLARADQKQNACVALAQLDHDFPSPGAPIKERAATEKKHLGC
jgi:tol-pal system protein YbgF